ncbi:hypothetical protein [Streptomyces sp. NPDC007205]|uniref:hypothetical protein n=1 Tax=Streptomyces sp. NPDC007205 TaxID=3154316 RepID=UPI0033E05EA3
MAGAPVEGLRLVRTALPAEGENTGERNAQEIADAPAACQDRADDALVRAAVVTDAPVVSLTPVLRDTGAEVAAGGPGALLRWKWRP